MTSQCHCCVSARSHPGVSSWLSKYLMWVTEARLMGTRLCMIYWPINAEAKYYFTCAAILGSAVWVRESVVFGLIRSWFEKICQGPRHVSYCLIFISCFIFHWPPSSPSSWFVNWLPPCLDFHLRLVVCPSPNWSHLGSPAFLYE